MLFVTSCVQNFGTNKPLVTKLQKKTKNTNGPKFMAAVSPYFKRSMGATKIFLVFNVALLVNLAFELCDLKDIIFLLP